MIRKFSLKMSLRRIMMEYGELTEDVFRVREDLETVDFLCVLSL